MEVKHLNMGKGKIEFSIKNQGKLFLVSISIILVYFGLFCNIAMNYGQPIKISYNDWDGRYLVWSYLLYPKAYFLPPLFLYLNFFIYTYNEDIPHYGIKTALWFAPFIQLQGVIWFWIMYGFADFSLGMVFFSSKSILNFFIILAINFLGAASGMQLKKYITKQKIQLPSEMK